MTIKEVARLADVSSAAVSRYLNGGPLSKEKKARIKKAIEETGYRPNLMAQTMRTGKINQIGIILPKIYSESASRIVSGIAEELYEENYMTVLGCTETDAARELRYIDIMQNNRVAGLILMGTTMTEEKAEAMRNCSIPLVVTGQNFPGFPCVYHDDFHAVKDLTELMLRKGRKKIVYLGVTEEDAAAGISRRKGAQAALEDAGLDGENMPRICTSFDAEGGFWAMTELLEAYPDLDGVVCATDSIALGAMNALKSKGIQVPEQVSIAGVGDSWAGTVAHPTLTSVHLHYRQCGMYAARMLLKLVNEEQEGKIVRQMMLDYSIVERGSI